MGARTIKNVGELKKILEYFNDSDEVILVENRYYGGGDEYYECEITVAEGNSAIIITPKPDAGIAGKLLNPDEL